MANVTDVVLLQNQVWPSIAADQHHLFHVSALTQTSFIGSYRIQIFWKGDPGVVDNFIIRYVNEDIMKKWYQDIDGLRVESAGLRQYSQHWNIRLRVHVYARI